MAHEGRDAEESFDGFYLLAAKYELSVYRCRITLDSFHEEKRPLSRKHCFCPSGSRRPQGVSMADAEAGFQNEEGAVVGGVVPVMTDTESLVC